jgi:hypothetical protein
MPVVGSANAGFPTTAGAILTTCNSACVFLSKLNPSGSSLLYSTYLAEQSTASTVVVDQNQNAYVGGVVADSGISPFSSCSTGYNGFVAEINAAGALPFSTCTGNLQPATDRGVTGLALDASGNLYVGGSGAGGLALKNPIQTNSSCSTNQNCLTSYVAAFNPSTNSLLFSSLIGGAQSE